MRNPLFLKALIVGLVLLIIGVPLTMIGSIVHERQQRQSEAVRDIGGSYAGSQRLLGPVLIMPYSEFYQAEETTTDDEGNKQKRTVERRVERSRYVLPEELKMAGNLDTSIKKRGIFQAPIYTWHTAIVGKFSIPEAVPVERSSPNSRISWGTPYVAVALSDMRGVTGTPALDWNGQRAIFEKGSGLAFTEGGMHAPVALPDAGKPASVAFSLKFDLNGTERLSVIPLGDSNHIQMQSTWQHPSFGGRFLPDAQTQSVGPQGFKAEWKVSALASAAAQQFQRAMSHNKERCPDGACLEAIEVRLIEPVNVYTQSDRALKYGFLFVGISFAAFFLFELMTRLRIHPAQYFLIGLAQALFFLLVLSLSEHLAFKFAYLAAAGASVGLIGYYLAHVMQSTWRGIGFSTVLGLLYGALYGLLISEDIALMLGSSLLFSLLAIAMILTRHLDWYQLGNSPQTATSD